MRINLFLQNGIWPKSSAKIPEKVCVWKMLLFSETQAGSHRGHILSNKEAGHERNYHSIYYQMMILTE